MNAPPGIKPTTEPGRGINRSGSDSALSIRKAKWHLVDVLGYSPIVADRFVRAWVVDRHEAVKAAEWAERLCGMTPEEIARLMAETPFARKRTKVRACDPRRDGRRQA